MVFDDDNMLLYLTPKEYLSSPMPCVNESDKEVMADDLFTIEYDGMLVMK